MDEKPKNFTLEIQKFAFAIFALIVGTGFSWVMKYEGTVYVQIFAVVVTGFLVAQAVVDWKAGK